MPFLKRWLTPITVTLLAGIFGTLFIVFAALMTPTQLTSILRDIGIALLSSALVAVAVHIWMTSLLQKDVFEAALGSLVPPEFKAEIKWLLGLSLFSRKCNITVELTDSAGGAVQIEFSIEKEITNVSASSQEVPAVLHLDDWGHGAPEIMECRFSDDEDQSPITPIIRDDKSHFFQKTRNLKSNHTLTILSRGREYGPKIGVFDLHLSTATYKPRVRVNYDKKKFVVYGGIISRADSTKPVFTHEWELEGTYLPHQSIRIRWHRL